MRWERETFKNNWKNSTSTYNFRGRAGGGSGGSGSNSSSSSDRGEYRVSCHNYSLYDHLAHHRPNKYKNGQNAPFRNVSYDQEQHGHEDNYDEEEDSYEADHHQSHQDKRGCHFSPHRQTTTNNQFVAFKNRRERGGSGRGYLVIGDKDGDALMNACDQNKEDLISVDSGANRLTIKSKEWFDSIEIGRGSLKLAAQGANLSV